MGIGIFAEDFFKPYQHRCGLFPWFIMNFMQEGEVYWASFFSKPDLGINEIQFPVNAI